MKRIHTLLFVFLFSVSVYAAKVETVEVYSQSMNKNVKVLVVSPEKKEIPASTIYLLHGYGGNENQWPGIKPDLPEIADRYNLVFVCPDAENSWYWDSPLNPAYRYETFVSCELVKYIDTHYPTKPERESRAITGLSMGGHGALWIAFHHKETFGAVGSTSGGVDIRPFPQNWDMSKQLGEMKGNEKVWDEHTVINQIDKLQNGDLSIITDCGFDDFFFEVNNNFHAKLLDRKIDHDYLVRPGGHDSNYWRNSLDYQILFFVKYFNKDK
ncbi:S-formylglutathione hydrolase FrmB [Parabacteroides sp. PF5-5]|uniref:alpha/beta hydrolase n=1 Tax=unclassified Parabacteroides TaxID=2649774 RepID=UPI0024755FD9|nr:MULTISPECIES: alpha/beta hydrolase family protein [unclassified Parabacteroides]MDH6306361.1 S-formylglutathione hydrolase FrmB [Parabacteroides sp. PH5-39]MDH6314633.1 S-formylglutathione hydrolase FrmB [Parabacteroides sp. PF5-13]MDH6321072.1 S-formylglutathione hydrolase FrmB [Parabacteroides sp. PH5-13]MDH6324804.1 S-formylglutathione hydrolase FrmB [Parabacteroides sp. PH5-8]MDH6325515.1 S-formylglutathione hydrolase FrmB [Parabacteroides sp. PH5-41]